MALSRRAALAGAAAFVSPASANDAPTPLVIGVLTDQSGLGASVSGPPLVQAVAMAVADTGPLPDERPVALITEAFERKPDDALAIVRRWFDQGVSAVVDVPGASAATAVQALAQARGRTVLITGSVSPNLTGRACSPYASTWSIDSASMATALARTLAKSGVRTWFLVVPDTGLGLAVQADATKAIEQAGGQVSGQSRHPADTTDFSSVIAQAKASGAQAVALIDVGSSLRLQLPQFQDGGLFNDGRKIVAFLSSITDIHAAGAAAAKGLLSASPFYWDQNDQSRSFGNRFLQATGQMPAAAHAAAYVAVRHFLRAVTVTESLDPASINREMRRTAVYFFGRNGRLRLDGRLTVDLSLLQAKPPDSMRNGWDHYETINGIPAADIFRPLNQSGCAITL